MFIYKKEMNYFWQSINIPPISVSPPSEVWTRTASICILDAHSWMHILLCTNTNIFGYSLVRSYKLKSGPLR